jgi:hypothetical protein
MINCPFDYYSVYITTQKVNENKRIQNLKYVDRVHHSIVKFSIHTADMHIIKMGRGVQRNFLSIKGFNISFLVTAAGIVR